MVHGKELTSATELYTTLKENPPLNPLRNRFMTYDFKNKRRLTQNCLRIEKMVDEMDATIMDWFYECCKINFNVKTMVQDSSELRAILKRHLQDFLSETLPNKHKKITL